MAEMDRLDELVAWMRKQGVRKLAAGQHVIEFERTPAPQPKADEPVKQWSDDELRRQRHEARRLKLAAELGFTPTDEAMERLP